MQITCRLAWPWSGELTQLLPWIWRRIDCPWDLGNFLVFDGKNAARIMRLGYLDALKALDYFDGRLYAFARGSMPKRLLPLGEQAGKLFGLDPSLLYTRETFNKRLAEAAILHEKETEQEMESLSHNLKNPAALLESLPKALRSINGKTVCLLLHHYMQAHPEKITLPRALKSLAKPQLDAALYLLREGLLRVGL